MRSGLTDYRSVAAARGGAALALAAALAALSLLCSCSGSKEEEAKKDIGKISKALGRYMLDNGGYPTNDQGLAALAEKPSRPPVPGNYKSGGYLSSVPEDPWGRAYVYYSPGLNGGPFSIESLGPDGADGGGDDIESWSLEKP